MRKITFPCRLDLDEYNFVREQAYSTSISMAKYIRNLIKKTEKTMTKKYESQNLKRSKLTS